MEADRLNALEAGCDDYATKPVDFPGLLIKIEKLARR
jgi:DNA-binding response OmpR family regulator